MIIGTYLPKDQSVINTLLISLYYGAIGVITYFIVINLTSFIGLIVAKRRKDEMAFKAFKITTILTLISTLIFFLIHILD
jgi:hypothetical protein